MQSTERKQRIKELRTRRANLTPQERETLSSRGLIATVEGRTLSLHNTLLVYLQSNGAIPTIVGGYQQWRTVGKQVRKGEHGYMIWFPVGDKTDDGDIIAAETFFTGTVFDISQVEAKGVSE